MFRFFSVIIILLGLGACNQHMGHALGAGAQYSKPAPVYVPPPAYTPPPQNQPIMIIGPHGTVICNQVGTIITCY